MEQRLLNTIACPKCFGQLEYDEIKQVLICQKDQLAYSIQDGITVLLENEAQHINSQETSD